MVADSSYQVNIWESICLLGTWTLRVTLSSSTAAQDVHGDLEEAESPLPPRPGPGFALALKVHVPPNKGFFKGSFKGFYKGTIKV